VSRDDSRVVLGSGEERGWIVWCVGDVWKREIVAPADRRISDEGRGKRKRRKGLAVKR